MKFWMHKSNLGKHFVRGISTGYGAVERYNSINSNIAENNQKVIEINTFTIDTIRLYDKSFVTSSKLVRFQGEDAQRRADSVETQNEIHRNRVKTWFDN